jgi:hypothetical protein
LREEGHNNDVKRNVLNWESLDDLFKVPVVQCIVDFKFWKVMFIHSGFINRERGPLTEKVHQIYYTEVFPSTIRGIQRIVNINIPSTQIFSPTIYAAA